LSSSKASSSAERGKKTAITIVALAELGLANLALWGRGEPMLLIVLVVVAAFFAFLN